MTNVKPGDDVCPMSDLSEVGSTPLMRRHRGAVGTARLALDIRQSVGRYWHAAVSRPRIPSRSHERTEKRSREDGKAGQRVFPGCAGNTVVAERASLMSEPATLAD